MAPQRDEIFKQKKLMTVFSIFTLKKFTNFHAIRSWIFHNICNEIGWPRFLRHLVQTSSCENRFCGECFFTKPNYVFYKMQTMVNYLQRSLQLQRTDSWGWSLQRLFGGVYGRRFFSADFRRWKKIRRIRIFGGGLHSPSPPVCDFCLTFIFRERATIFH